MNLLFVLLASLFTYSLGACPSGTISGLNGYCYQGYSAPSTWYQAEATCEQSGNGGGHLASVKNGFTNADIASLFDNQLNSSDFWLGGTTNFLDGNWSWTDFTPFTYTNWEPGQQNNSLGLCLSQKFSNLRWLPVLCNQKKPFVCEWEEVVAPSTTISPKPTICPNGINWFKYAPTNKCYYFSGQSLVWSDSLIACQKLYPGATLASIHSDAENNQIVSWFDSLAWPAPSNNYNWWLWIGLRDINGQGNYQWVDGTPYDYQPSLNGNRGCVHIDPDYSPKGSWYFDNCTPDVTEYINFGYICELQLS